MSWMFDIFKSSLEEPPKNLCTSPTHEEPLEEHSKPACSAKKIYGKAT